MRIRDPESGRRSRKMRRRHYLGIRPPIDRPTPIRRLRYWLRLAKPEFDGLVQWNSVSSDLDIDHMHGEIVVRRALWLAKPHRSEVYRAGFTAGRDKEAALAANASLSQAQGRRVKILFSHLWYDREA